MKGEGDAMLIGTRGFAGEVDGSVAGRTQKSGVYKAECRSGDGATDHAFWVGHGCRGIVFAWLLLLALVSFVWLLLFVVLLGGRCFVCSCCNLMEVVGCWMQVYASLMRRRW